LGRIINAVGNSNCTDTINDQPVKYWNDTVILVVWDDWGGWYDHVSPASPSGPGIGYSNGDSGWYVHGNRVPFLVISAYNKHVQNGLLGYTGYISGPLDNHTCVQTNYCHDFGSILNFVEFTFGLASIGDGHSDYADDQAPDGPNVCSSCTYSLSDFFNFDLPPNNFNPITSFKYQETCFHNPDQPSCWPNAPDEDPDDDAYED
jgi:hypothetical protein